MASLQSLLPISFYLPSKTARGHWSPHLRTPLPRSLQPTGRRGRISLLASSGLALPLLQHQARATVACRGATSPSQPHLWGPPNGQWLRLLTFTAGPTGSVLGKGTIKKIPYALWQGQNKQKRSTISRAPFGKPGNLGRGRTRC